jgi:uncharacterized protein YciI
MTDYIYLVRPAGGADLTSQAADHLIRAHADYLQVLVDQGIVLLVGHTDGTRDGFGLAIFRADDLEQAERLVAADPAVAAGVLRAEVHPFVVTMHAGRWPEL